ncbi:MAG: class I adenylate-forming enzyme family protein [Actinomycetes bacterium]
MTEIDSLPILTAAASFEQQRRVAGSLTARGLTAGDRIAFLVSNHPLTISAVLGALRIGVIPVMLDPALSENERADVLADADCALIIESHESLQELNLGEPIDIASAPLGRPMHYTSGTTGRRKGVWSGVLSEAAGAALVAEERDQWSLRSNDIHLVVSGLYHSAPLRFPSGTLLAGGSVAVLPHFSGDAFLAALRDVQPTTIFCSPAHLQRLTETIDAGATLPDVSQVRLLAHAGAPCARPLKERIHGLFPSGSVWEFYGATEGQFTVCPPDEWASHPGSVGRVRPGRELSVDPDGTIWCRVPDYARFSYWGDSAKTAAAWRGDAFSVGDLGRLDSDGYLYLDGRRDDLIISGGVNVYPREVELAFEGCPGIGEIAVFARPDDRWGQRVCAVVTGNATDDELRNWAEIHLSAARRPKEYHRLPAIPHSGIGKVRRRFLAAELGLEE